MKKLLLVTITLFFGLVFIQRAYAQGPIDLREYIAGVGFVPHTLSTGEYIQFTGDGGAGNGSPVRQYKNTNYEQFFVGGSGIFRREDTSWAPVPGFGDALCENGNKAIYALVPNSCREYTPGEVVESPGSFWAPASAEVGVAWGTGMHQIVPIDSGVGSGSYEYNLPPLHHCPLSNLEGYTQACVGENNQTLVIDAHYGPNEFVFCTGVRNPTDLIVIRGLSGPGAGDTFFYMRGWGLVGFAASGFEAGLLEGPGISGGTTENCISPLGSVAITELPRQIMGYVTSSKTNLRALLSGKLAEVTNEKIQGATVCAYQGTTEFRGLVSNNGAVGSTIRTFQGSATTDERGFYALDSAWILVGDHQSYNDIETPPSNLVVFYCGTELKDVYRMDVRRTASSMGMLMPVRYTRAYSILTGDEVNPSIVMPPLDVTIHCDPNVTPGSFPEPARTLSGEEHPECPNEAPYVDRSRSNLASCAPGGDGGVGTLHHPNLIYPTFDIHLIDDQFIGADPESVPEETLPDEPPEGRTDILGSGLDYAGLVSMVTRFGAGGFFQGFYPPPQSEGVNPTPPDCELLREANFPISTLVSSGMNALKAWGFAPHLAAPSSYAGDVANEETYNPSKSAARYQTTDKSTVVCQSDTYGDVTLAQIQPPRAWLPFEEYCNPGGTLPSGDDCPFVLPVSYFRYDLIYYAMTPGHKVTFENQSWTDSYDNQPGHGKRLRCYAPPCPWDGGSSGVDADPYQEGHADITQTHIMVPTYENDGGNYSKAAAVSIATDYIGNAKPPGKALYSPGKMYGPPLGEERMNYTSTTERTDPITGEVLEYTMEGLNYLVNGRGAYSRIGLPSYLCMFSDLDGHHLWPLFPTLDLLHPTTTFYDFRMEDFQENWGNGILGAILSDLDTIYGWPQTGVFNGLWNLITSFFGINNTNWQEDDGEGHIQIREECIDVDHPGCSDCDPTANCEGGSGCIGCELACDDEGQNCRCQRTTYDYDCLGDIRQTIELQDQTAPHFSNKNTEAMDAVSFSLFPIARVLPRFDTGALCYFDGYTSRADSSIGQGYFTGCGKDHSWTTDLLRKMVGTPLGNYIDDL